MQEVKLSFLEKEEQYIFDYVAKQASGSVYYKSGNNVLLAAVTIDSDSIVEEDFLPLTVQYIEKSYAAGKFPGGYVKREAKPGDFETLTARIVDRSLRPLFPKGYCYPTQITIMVLSADNDADLQILALNAASSALYVSEIPLNLAVNGVRIGRIGEEFVVNPSLKAMEQSTLDLFVSGVDEDLLMIEMRTFGGVDVESPTNPLNLVSTLMDDTKAKFSANELTETELIQALELAKTHIATKSKILKESFVACIKEPLVFTQERKSYHCQNLQEFITQNYLEELRAIISYLSKTERHSRLKAFAKRISQDYATKNPEDLESLEERTSETLDTLKRQIIRTMILEEGVRADGRKLNEVRPISIETNLLPKAHSSVLFTRGQTQALVVCTLGGEMDAQNYELLTDKGASKERFMVHYNFPPFSVGEASPIGATGRRELGHGNLAKRALECSIINAEQQTIRLVSEILESNGSSSMATVCGGSLALAAADVECTTLIAGVAMGLISAGNKYAILTDIMGLEDHDGDMDFKVAGSKNGITALQMDIKLGGLSTEILNHALLQAKEARLHILGIMESAKEKIVLNTAVLPSAQIFAIHPSKIVEVIGQAGKTIKEIIEKFEVAIDLNRDNGEVKVSGKNREKVDAAKEYIIGIANAKEEKPNIAELYKVGDVYEGKVKKILDFGAFVELPHHYDGLLHISKITSNRNAQVSDYLNEGDRVRVEVLSLNKNKVELGLQEKLSK
ncbi:polyribonucleotide nucleotidyltransferase [Helicobacter sp. MIT 11-5569]|uniref:polyribonucleotide nucleotidyltransferase n=1 Tax=Helicobacter sp. MIT 11-5569 TaxID=1548151 RepID=UPI00051FBB57|nr:polyribonucleotide nucleotidyltransferase [Helicobacter sp. MIT 11-5569]TLD82926.1 polyribonucleotide nucleotidyltransferase [Helicobacter sp. MIT 11-5569]